MKYYTWYLAHGIASTVSSRPSIASHQGRLGSVFRRTAACATLLPAIFLLPDVEWHIFVLDHMQDLALHCQDKKYDPVAEKYGPEDRNVEYREESHHKSYHKSFCDCILIIICWWYVWGSLHTPSGFYDDKSSDQTTNQGSLFLISRCQCLHYAQIFNSRLDKTHTWIITYHKATVTVTSK